MEPKYTIEDLKAGRVAIETTDQKTTREVLSLAFPQDDEVNGDWHSIYPQPGEVIGKYSETNFEYESNITPVVFDCDLVLHDTVFEGVEYKSDSVREFETGSRRDDDSDKPLVDHLDPYLRLRFGYLLRQGANKYDKGNWRKGQPTETALESLHRHLAKFELNLQHGIPQDEDHLASIIFNVMLIMKNEEKEGITVNHFYGTMK